MCGSTAVRVDDPGSLSHRLRWLLLALATALFVVLRFRWVGHLLVWDEAMNICTTRTLAAGGHDCYSYWIWRHPPFFSALMLVLQPLRAGFAERVESLNVGLGVIALLLMFALNRRLWGDRAALCTAFCLAVMPGAAFFDVWIKQDVLVALFGLTALLCLSRGRVGLAGLALGGGLLTKETAVFYVAAALLLRVFQTRGRGLVRDAALLGVLPALLSAWWYVWAATVAEPGSGTFYHRLTLHARFATMNQTLWQESWHYYFSQLPDLLGWVGVALALAGILTVCRTAMASDADSRLQRIWPLFLLVPPYLVLPFLSSKVAWIVIALLPAWATVAGLGLWALLRGVAREDARPPESARAGGRPREPSDRWSGAGVILRGCAALLVMAGFLTATARLRYEPMLQRVAEGQWRGAVYSRDSAQALNARVKDGERILVTLFHYWKGPDLDHICPIFTYYLTPKVDVLVRPVDAAFTNLVRDIKTYRIDWALLSPEPGPHERDMFGGFTEQLGLTPVPMPQAGLFHTTGIYQPAAKP